LGTLTLSGLGWAWLAPDQSLPWLHRNVILMVAAVATTLIAGFGLPQVPRLASDWIAAGRRAVPLLAGLALAVLAIVLGQELTTYVPFEGVPMALWAKIVVTAALSGLVIGCLVFALVPKLDPLQLSDRGRTLYVYAGEAIILLICLHLRLTLPDLFRHEIMRKYWMLIVLGVAFLGAGLSELFRRRGMPVLSEPLERTAELLPLAPAIGFGFAGRISEGGPLAGDSPAVWFLGAIFYGILAATRQKARFAVASLAAMNVGLWVLWYRLELDFANRPQLFLIPVALCLLVAEYLNHNRLSTAQSTGLRYVSLGMIYISSAAEYLPTVGQSVWLPLVLIVLSLVGILAGILLRIRSFLYMGVTFLTLVIVTMIRYAYVDREWTWILWVCCIILGTGVLAAVGFYEKRRDRMLAAVRRFRQWEM
jgi:hypothetical protein